MANDLQSLMAMVQGNSLAGEPPVDTPDLLTQLQALLGRPGGSPGGMPRQGGGPAATGSPGGMPRLAGGPAARGSPGGMPVPPPMATALNEMAGPPGTMGPGDQRAVVPDEYGNEAIKQGGYPTAHADESLPGQKNMGAYLNANKPLSPYADDFAPGEEDALIKRNKPMTTEDELADVQKKMGADPVDDGNFPSPKEIKLLNEGKMSPADFDAKWGKGAAKEMMDTDGDGDIDKDDDGDHEYR